MVFNTSQLILLSISVLSLVLSTLHFSYWYVRRQEKIYLLISIAAIVHMVYLASRYMQISTDDYTVAFFGVRLHITAALIIPWIFFFVPRLIEESKDYFVRELIVTVICIIAILLLWFTDLVVPFTVSPKVSFFGEPYLGFVGGPFYILVTFIIFSVFIYILLAILRSQPSMEKRAITISFILSILFGFFDVMYVVLNKPAPRLFDFAIIPFAVSFNIVQVLRQKRIAAELETLVVTRTSELQKSNVALTRQMQLNNEATEKVRHQQKWYTALFHSIFDAIFIHDAQSGKIIDVNNQTLKLFGYSKEEILQCNIGDLSSNVPPYTNGQAMAYIHAAAKSKDITFEWFARRKDGSLFYADVKMRYEVIEGNPIVIVTCRDITEKKQFQDELQQNEELLSAVLEATPIMFWVKDNHGKILMVNRAAAALEHLEEVDIIGKTDFDLYPPQLAEQYLRADRELIDSKKPKLFYHEEHVDPGTGKRHTLLVSKIPFYNAHGVESGIYVFALDITEQEKMRLALLDSEKRLRAVAETIDGAFWLGDVSSLEYANPAYKELFGITSLEQNPEHFPFKPLLHEDDQRMITFDLERDGFASDTVFTWEIRVMAPGKDLKWVRVKSFPLKGSESDRHKRAGLAIDITKEKYAAVELLKAKEKAEELTRVRANFLASMSHELRTPLMGIMGSVDAVREMTTETQIASAMDNITSAGQRLLSTMDFILQLSQSQTGKLTVAVQEVNVSKVITEVVTAFSTQAAYKKISLSYESHGGSDIHIPTDERYLIQILQQLISNAVKFTEEGSVVVSTRYEMYDGIRFLDISVKDTGIGIDPQFHQMIFEEFRQVSEGHNRQFEGVGLGLTLVKQFAQLIGATVSLTSKPGEGSCFTMHIPSLDPAFRSEKQAVHASAPKTREGKLKGFYVEDDPVNSDIVRMYLRDLADIEVVASGNEAVENLATLPDYDFVLMDINLGQGMSGIEVARHIRTIPKYQDIPIIAVTAYAMKGDREEILQSDCTHYLAKPFAKKDLTLLVQEACNTQS